LFGVKKIGSVTGLLYSSTASGNLLAAPIGGFLYDAYHSYYPPIAVAGGFLLWGMLFIFCIDPTQIIPESFASVELTDAEAQTPCSQEDETVCADQAETQPSQQEQLALCDVTVEIL
jgi:hypothetical protein